MWLFIGNGEGSANLAFQFVTSLRLSAMRPVFITPHGSGMIHAIRLEEEVIYLWKRYIIEFGSGIDLHGQDMTKASQKAVKDAINRSCLCGLEEVLGIKDFDDIRVHVTIACPIPSEVREADVLKVLPVGQKSISFTKGGMTMPGLYVKGFGDRDDSVIVANACVEVSVNVNAE